MHKIERITTASFKLLIFKNKGTDALTGVCVEVSCHQTVEATQRYLLSTLVVLCSKSEKYWPSRFPLSKVPGPLDVCHSKARKESKLTPNL